MKSLIAPTLMAVGAGLLCVMVLPGSGVAVLVGVGAGLIGVAVVVLATSR